MRNAGRVAAAIEILEDFARRHIPLKTAIADWARGARYAGAKDRAWISGLCLDVLRRRNSLAEAVGNDSARAIVLGALRWLWNLSVSDIAELAAEEPHGPGALTEIETAALTAPALGETGAAHIRGDYPVWLEEKIARVFGDDRGIVMAAFGERADVDLRLNTLKAETEKTLAALSKVKGRSIPILTTAARIAAPPADERAAGVTVIPAFNKGWVEVQDLGSQIAAAAAGDIKGAQVLDFCAGGGGKTLALAAMMENTGQLYAYDKDAQRLKPLFHRAKRAGVRNLQIRSPASGEGLDDLTGKMDIVFIDAPCTGTGTWRRRPDTKWRLTPQQLERRKAEQDAVLSEAAAFVKPGGYLVYATCSFLMEENEDRIKAFLKDRRAYSFIPALDRIAASGLLTPQGREALGKSITPDGAIRLTPDKNRADGFFIAVLQLAKPVPEDR